MENTFYSLLVGLCFTFILHFSSVEGWNDDKVKLREIDVLTLNAGEFTVGRRSAGVLQLKCVGGTAGCFKSQPQHVQCYNRGWDGEKINWECKAEMDADYTFGRLDVSCEGYDSPWDDDIRKGSCGLMYELDWAPGVDRRRGQDSLDDVILTSSNVNQNYQTPKEQSISQTSSTRSSEGRDVTWTTFVLAVFVVIGLLILSGVVIALWENYTGTSCTQSEEFTSKNSPRHHAVTTYREKERARNDLEFTETLVTQPTRIMVTEPTRIATGFAGTTIR